MQRKRKIGVYKIKQFKPEKRETIRKQTENNSEYGRC
jgi:cell fate regulator YaaT (PSP1 superfamily)